MAFQQQGMMGQGGQGVQGDQHAPPATEYTLQGVMRFLQIEWHNHERARNAWDIERAEMKAKIAKQEGECRQAKRINEQLERQVRMLEKALKAERAKKKTAEPAGPEANGKAATETETANAEPKTKARGDADKSNGGLEREAKLLRNTQHNSFLQTDELLDATEKEKERHLDNTTRYLKNCMKEIQYLLTPPQHLPPPILLPNGSFASPTGLPEAPLSVEDIYARNQQQRHQQRMPGQGLSPNTMPNHQPPPVPTALPHTSGVQHDSRGQRFEFPEAPQGSDSSDQQVPMTFEEPAETIVHTYDSRGRPAPDNEIQQPVVRQLRHNPDPDAWQFEEEPTVQIDEQSLNQAGPRRPDTDLFPSAQTSAHLSAKSPPRAPGSHRRKSSGAQAMARRRSSQGKQELQEGLDTAANNDPSLFKVKFALRGHLDVVRSVVFSGGGSPSEPEICTAGDDGTIKRWIVPATYQNFNSGSNSDLDIAAYFTHRGHDGVVTSLATCPASTGFSTGGRANGDGWIFSGGQDATVRIWERGRVDPKATLEGHTDAVWSVCVLPAPVGTVFGPQSSNFGGPDRLLVVSGSADGSVKVWAVSAPPQASSPSTGSRRGVGGSRRHSVTSGSNYPTSPQPSVASATPFSYTLVHTIERAGLGDQKPSPTCISPLSPSGDTFVVSYTDSSVLIFDTRTGEEVIGMASGETYDGTMNTSINSVVATSLAMEGSNSAGSDSSRGLESEDVGAGATGSREGVEGVVISGHEDRYVRFFDGNSGQCTYNMLAHPSAISSLCLSKDGREAVSAGHDASIRFWSLEKRICTQDIVSHRSMRGEGVCCVCWSQDGRLVVSAGGDGVVKVFAR